MLLITSEPGIITPGLPGVLEFGRMITRSKRKEPNLTAAMTSPERQLEERLVAKLVDLKYAHRPDIR